jgi:hypothetical protein
MECRVLGSGNCQKINSRHWNPSQRQTEAAQILLEDLRLMGKVDGKVKSKFNCQFIFKRIIKNEKIEEARKRTTWKNQQLVKS